MHERAARFVEMASEAYGVEPDVHTFPEGTKTAADAADAIGCTVAQIASSIVLMADDRPVIVITSGANLVDESAVGDRLEATQVRMADPDEVKSATGWSIGGVPPICHEHDLLVLMDETLLEFDEVWAAAGTPDSVWPIAPDELLELSGAQPASITR
jgi:prolyl-tRNA editing enzyme YbaK/EbsC (Cys-tRNA(Pro) deacylase)